MNLIAVFFMTSLKTCTKEKAMSMEFVNLAQALGKIRLKIFLYGTCVLSYFRVNLFYRCIFQSCSTSPSWRTHTATKCRKNSSLLPIVEVPVPITTSRVFEILC